MFRSLLLALLTLASFASPSLAQHAGDVILFVENNTIVTKLQTGSTEFIPNRVYGSDLGEVFPDFTDEPGFDSLPQTFPASSRIGFRILDALRSWNGSNFTTIPQERLEVAYSTLSVLTPPTPQVVDGFTLTVAANGEWHRHLEYTLQAPAAMGIYLLQLQLYSNADINPSLPFWIVYNQGETEAVHQAATDWVESNLVNPPACGTSDFNGDGDFGTDQDIEAFFSCLAGFCCGTCWQNGADFNGDGDYGTDQDIEAFFRVLAGVPC
jgi:hypothetical protein